MPNRKGDISHEDAVQWVGDLEDEVGQTALNFTGSDLTAKCEDIAKDLATAYRWTEPAYDAENQPIRGPDWEPDIRYFPYVCQSTAFEAWLAGGVIWL